MAAWGTSTADKARALLATAEAASEARAIAEDDGELAASLTGNALERRRWIKRHVYRRLPAKWLFRFLYMYVFRLGVLDGLNGFRFCLFISSYEMDIGLKLAEIRREDAA